MGRRLVHELELEPGVDTLGKWMAHYVAELIGAAESAEEGEPREAARQRCADAVLRLWAHRCALGERRPLAAFEPVRRALASLDPEGPARYFRPRDGQEENQWIAIALGVDQGARQLIDLAVRLAAAEAHDQEDEWLELVRGTSGAADPELEAVLALAARGDAVREAADGGEDRRWLLAAREQLVVFTEAVEAFNQLIDKLVGEEE